MDTVADDIDGVNDIGHANLHSCGSEVGFCVPFIGNDGTLATHTTALKGNWVWDDDDSPDIGSAEFTSAPVLDKGTYSMISHGRFYFYGTQSLIPIFASTFEQAHLKYHKMKFCQLFLALLYSQVQMGRRGKWTWQRRTSGW